MYPKSSTTIADGTFNQPVLRALMERASAVPLAVYVGVVSALVNLMLLALSGVRHGGDTARYLDGAANLLAGRPLQDKQASYLGYVSLVAFSESVGHDARLVVLFQLVVASLAAVALYDLGRQLSSRLAGVAAAACFIANVDIARWHVFVLTDSFYISLVILCTWLVHRAAERSRWWYPAAVVMLFCSAFIRPNGWVLLPIAAIYWMVRARLSRRLKFAAAGLAVGGFLAATAFVGAFRQGIQAESPEMWLRQGTVIWKSDEWHVQMPVDATASSAVGWPGAVRYVAAHPWASARLAVTRMAVELFHARPFYSATRNWLAAISALIFYPFAVLGWWRLRTVPLAQLMTAVIGGHLLIIALTFADWDGRFLLYFLPLIYVLATCELSGWTRRRGTAYRVP